ncbi:MAG: hypothetical protein EOO40_10970 [Deltaproteobacteria bacterium]|nr:MAG: hypothetical protein EOO40_10970 [Deltaproteobacteria bacterium]
MHLRSFCGLALLCVAFGLPLPARAQYKNASLALDGAYSLITRPPVTDSNGAYLAIQNMPQRLAYGGRFGAEVNFKLHSDHWWFVARLNVPIYSFSTMGDDQANDPATYQYDQLADKELGKILGLQMMPGVRYYFFTDRTRPFAQLGISYMHLFSLTGQYSQNCVLGGGLCNDTSTTSALSYGDVFLPASNILSVHGALGVEFLLVRDIALTVTLDYQRWIFFNTTGNDVFTGSLGILFFG